MVTKVRSYRLQVLGYRAQVPGRCRSQVPDRQVAGAGQTGCRCRAGAGQVPGRCWAGAGQVLGTQAQRSRVLALYVQGVSPISPGC